ncbi:MAG: diacylglycerol kinase family lipid kinase [Bacteroidales bacterium]|nr:diacylglycerol kinase family lipid kinase [Bacteroidales bacterium]
MMLFIVNPISGNGRKLQIVTYLKKMGYKVVCTEYAGHGEILAREASEEIVVAVGGDGTVNEVARGLAGTGRTLGIIPCGSGDGLALHLGISRNFRKALKIVEAGKTRPMDAATVNGRHFFSVCGTGFDAIVSERFAASGKRGLMNYIVQAIRTWVGFTPERYVVEIDGETLETEAAFITVGNSDQWGNRARITPLADIGDGELDVTIVRMFRTWEIPWLALRLMSGTAHKSGKTTCLRGKQVLIRRQTSGPAHADGDWFSDGELLDIKVFPHQLKVIVP